MPSRTVPESGGSVPRISLSSVDLPAPLGPIKPSRSPRMMRSVRSRTSVRPPNALVTCESSATSRPERSPASSASFTLPSRARRSLRSRRSASSLRTRPSSRVRRASTPLRIQASSCAQNWSNLRCATASAASSLGLARFVGGEVAGIRAQEAAIELDDARGHAIEKRAVVRDHDGGGRFGDELLDQRDAVEVEMIGRLVQQQEVRRQRERERQRRALLLAARRGLGRGRLVEAEAMQVFDEPRLGAPAVALVVNRFELAAKREAFAQRRRARQLRLLLDQHDREPVARLHLPVVELPLSRDHLQQRRLAGAVAADEADALAFAHDEVGAVEQADGGRRRARRPAG